MVGTNVSPFMAQGNLSSVPAGGRVQGIRVVGRAVTLACLGASRVSYAVQRATDVRFTQNLMTVQTTNAPAHGVFRCTDSSPPDSAGFYRLQRQ